MSTENRLRAVAPRKLGAARALAHRAAQLLTAAARANLEARHDDSHSNLGWDSGALRFVSRPLPAPPAPGQWHSEGFVGAIATGEEVLTLDDISRGLPAFVKQAFDIGVGELGVSP